MIKNIIFDLYGTLLDICTDENNPQFWMNFTSFASQYKKYKPDDFKKKYIELCKKYEETREEIDLLNVFKDLFPKYKNDSEVMNKITREFRKLSTIKLKPYKGALRLLDKLHQMKLNVYLLSNAQECFTIDELKLTGLYDKFDAINISSIVGYKKPNPLFMKDLLTRNNLKADESIMIGNDYECDIKMANSLNIKAIYLETETSSKMDKVEKIKGFNYLKILHKIKTIIKDCR